MRPDVVSEMDFRMGSGMEERLRRCTVEAARLNAMGRYASGFDSVEAGQARGQYPQDAIQLQTFRQAGSMDRLGGRLRRSASARELKFSPTRPLLHKLAFRSLNIDVPVGYRQDNESFFAGALFSGQGGATGRVASSAGLLNGLFPAHNTDVSTQRSALSVTSTLPTFNTTGFNTPGNMCP